MCVAALGLFSDEEEVGEVEVKVEEREKISEGLEKEEEEEVKDEKHMEVKDIEGVSEIGFCM